MNKDSIDSLAARLAASVPDGVRALGQDLEKNFQSVLRSALGQLDLVTREEFDVSRTVLTRTQERLAELEQKLAELEAAADE
ncbi:MAG: accessory factor UbiK family protein [Pseudomonadota bacterium]